MNLKNKIKKINGDERGFTLLISIIVTGVLLLVSFVIANVALKQLILVYTGAESQKAFYAADSGIECAAYWDTKNPGGVSPFSMTAGGSVTCNGNPAVTTGSQTVGTNPPQSSVIGGVVPAIGNSASYIGTDTTTQGNWHGGSPAYGTDGYNVIGGTQNYPSYATVSPSGNLFWTWSASPVDPRAPYINSVSSSRIASTWYSSTSFNIDVNITDSNSHKVSLYLLDWDSYIGGRVETVDVLDGSTLAVLSTQSISNFSNGKYLTWSVSGHVIFRITNNNAPSNAVISGIFFDPSASGSTSSLFQINFTNGCAIVQVTKQPGGVTKIDSKGYNTCTSSLRKFERGITITY